MVIRGGDESPNREKVFERAALPIAVAIGCERFGYYVTTGSITTYFTKKMSLSNVRATQMQAIQQAIVFCCPVFGGILADLFLGRFKIAIASAAMACTGLVFMCIASYPSLQKTLGWLFLLGLLGIFSVGASTFKPALIVFGGDQFPESVPALIPKRKLYFDFIYFVTNVGSFIAFAIITSMAVNGMGKLSVEYSFWVSFIMGGGLYGLAALVLVVFSKHYWVKACEGTALIVFGSVTVNAIKSRKGYNGLLIVGAGVTLVICVILSVIGFFWVNKVYQIILAVLIVASCGILITIGRDQTWIKDALDSPNLGTNFSVLEVKNVGETYRILPFVALAIPFWAIYNQMNTNYVLMGCQMYSPTKFFVPSTMSMFNAIGCMTFAVFVQMALVPLFKKMKYPLTNMRRIVMGISLCVIAMAISAGLEVYRKSTPIKYVECTDKMAYPSDDHPYCLPTQIGTQVPLHSVCVSWDDDAGKYPDIYQSEASLFWLIPQYLIIGFAEIFVAATYYDVFYAEVPPVLRTVCQTINNFSTSLGTLVGAVINTLFASQVPDNLNDGNLEYVYIAYVVISLLTLGCQVFAARTFDCKSDNELLLSLGYPTRTQLRNQKKGIVTPAAAEEGVHVSSKGSKSGLKEEDISSSSSEEHI